MTATHFAIHTDGKKVLSMATGRSPQEAMETATGHWRDSIASGGVAGTYSVEVTERVWDALDKADGIVDPSWVLDNEGRLSLGAPKESAPQTYYAIHAEGDSIRAWGQGETRGQAVDAAVAAARKIGIKVPHLGARTLICTASLHEKLEADGATHVEWRINEHGIASLV